MKPTELIHLIKIAHDYMVIIAMDKAFEWEKGYGDKLIKEIKEVTVPEYKINDYYHFVDTRKNIWELDLELNVDDVFIGYTELICAAHEYLVKRHELMLVDVLSQSDSDVEHKTRNGTKCHQLVEN